MQVLNAISVGMAILTELQVKQAELAAGQSVNLPEFNTYIGGKHVAIVVTVRPI